MTSFIPSYWAYLTQPLPAPKPVYGFAGLDNFWPSVILWTSFFTVMNLLMPTIIQTLFPTWYKQLPTRKKQELPPYVVSMIHHLLAVPVGWFIVISDYQGLINFTHIQPPYSTLESVVIPFCIGNIIADTVCFAIPQCFRMNFEYLIHHGLSLWLVYELVGGEMNFDRYFAHLLICDTTNIFFCTAWILRLAGYRDSFAVKALEILFAIGFLFLRGFNISIILMIMYFLPEATGLGLAKYTLPLIALLQWFWLAKIFGAIFAKLFTSSKKEEKKDKEDKIK